MGLRIFARSRFNRRRDADSENIQFAEVRPETIGQFTGLAYKKGSRWQFLPDEGAVSPVEYYGSGFALHGNSLNTIVRGDIEVIGNIYEKSELLK